MLVRTYSSPLFAGTASEFLRRNGIASHVSPRLNADGVTGAQGSGVCDLHVVTAVDAACAARFLAFFDRTLPRLDPDWESKVAPDLARLEERFRPRCPHCQATLDPAAPAACPRCRQRVEFVELVVAQHGPEALEPCYETPPAPEEDGLADDEADLQAMLAEVVQSCPVKCPPCGYSLDGLPPSGRCPECGQPYSKADILTRSGS